MDYMSSYMCFFPGYMSVVLIFQLYVLFSGLHVSSTAQSTLSHRRALRLKSYSVKFRFGKLFCNPLVLY